MVYERSERDAAQIVAGMCALEAPFMAMAQPVPPEVHADVQRLFASLKDDSAALVAGPFRFAQFAFYALTVSRREDPASVAKYVDRRLSQMASQKRWLTPEAFEAARVLVYELADAQGHGKVWESKDRPVADLFNGFRAVAAAVTIAMARHYGMPTDRAARQLALDMANQQAA